MCNSCGTGIFGGCGCNQCGNGCGGRRRWSREYRLGYMRGYREGFNAANSGCGNCGCCGAWANASNGSGCGTCRDAYSNDCGSCCGSEAVPIMERDCSC